MPTGADPAPTAPAEADGRPRARPRPAGGPDRRRRRRHAVVRSAEAAGRTGEGLRVRRVRPPHVARLPPLQALRRGAAARDVRPVLRERYVAANGIRLFCVEAGPTAGPLVLLVHGWPESWWSWRRQLPVLGAAGYHAVAVDLPGYGRSDKPDAGYDEAWVN